MSYSLYANIENLIQSLSSIDFGDAPEDGNIYTLPNFTGGDATLYPDEFSGRHGEGISSAGRKLNSNFSTIIPFLTAYRSYISDTIGKRSLYYDINSTDLDTSIQSNQVVYIKEGIYHPYTIDQYSDTFYSGIYMKRGHIHRIYTHGYISDITNTLTPGKTYGLATSNNSEPEVLATGFNHVISNDIIPIYRAITSSDAIIIPYRPIDGITYPYI